MRLWKELIDIPEKVHRGDFVLKLAEGLDRAEETVRSYVVTDQIADSFDAALSVIRRAFENRRSHAARLHGSFGSGKSHFMAILDLLLAGNLQAASKEGLAPIVTKYADLRGRKVLMVPYHMVGARDMESAILGGYVEAVRERHPDAPIPGVFLAERVFENAEKLRAQMGDKSFFGMLGDGSSRRQRWGKRAATWDLATYERALHAPPGSKDRTDLVGDLVANVLPAMADLARVGARRADDRGDAEREAFVSLDEGLSIVSQHAAELGYEGVILFLDELILWLASHAGDIRFINREGQKLSKLVEAQHANRPIPIISFVAEQKDITEFVGESQTGAELKSLNDSIKWWKDRFDTITLDDNNLPAIIEKRLLAPVSREAAEEIRSGFEQGLAKMRRDLDVLLGSEADVAMFRRVFPFSPVLMQVLIVLSSALQRERTALRIMSMLLSRNRDRLALGDVVPVGDLWDVLAEGNEPFSEAMRAQFRAAARLYEQKLRPELLRDSGLDPAQLERAEAGEGDDETQRKVEQLRTDDRLVKTLLLAQLAPEVDAFKDLTARRLHALNWGTVQSQFRGGESQQVVAKLRRWAGRIAELRIESEAADPKVSIQLTDIDIDEILAHADLRDNAGNRRTWIRRILFEKLGVEYADQLFTRYQLDWRGGPREIRVAYANVRTLSAEQLRSLGDQWSLFIDYPFDEESFSPQDDWLKLEQYRREHAEGTLTLAWLPGFFSNDGLQLLGKLIKVDSTLQRFDEVTAHIPPVQRPVVKTQLQAIQQQLGAAVEHALLAAYGLADEKLDAIDPNYEVKQHVVSLARGHLPRQPGSATFAEALLELADDALRHQFPGAPALPDEPPTKGQLGKMADVLSALYEGAEKRHLVEDRALRKVIREYAQPLRLAQMGETHVVRTDGWRDPLDRAAVGNEAGVAVGILRDALDPPSRPTGLPTALQDAILIVWAAVSNRSFRRAGLTVEPQIGKITDDTELAPEALPSEEVWTELQKRLESLLGLVDLGVRRARNVNRLASRIREKLEPHKKAVAALPKSIESAGPHLGLGPSDVSAGKRHRTARCAKRLVERVLAEESPKAMLEMLANLELATSAAAVGTSIESAEKVNRTLNNAKWHGFEKMVAREAEAHLDADGASRLKGAREFLLADEYVLGAATFEDLEEHSLSWLASVRPTPPPPPAPPPQNQWTAPVASVEQLDAAVDRMRRALDAGKRLDVSVTEKEPSES